MTTRDALHRAELDMRARIRAAEADDRRTAQWLDVTLLCACVAAFVAFLVIGLGLA